MALHVITGATGFLGRHFIQVLLKQNEQASVIVRPESLPTFQWFVETLTPEEKIHLRVWKGNIRQSQLGLSAEALHCLQQEKVYFWHLAANLSFQQADRDAIMADNIGGTEHVVALVNQLPMVERLCYVSTAYVAGDCTTWCEDDPLEQGQHFRNMYEQSKYEAERLVRTTCQKPTTIFRPSIIIGDAYEGKATGCTFGYYRFAFVFFTFKQWLIKKVKQERSLARKLLGLMYIPEEDKLQAKRLWLFYPKDCRVNLIPVDFVIKSMLLLSQKEGKLNTFHLTHPNPPTFELLFRALLSDLKVEGVHLVPVPPSVFRAFTHLLYWGCVPWRKYLDSAKKYLPYITVNYSFSSENVQRAGLRPPDISPQFMHRVNQYAIEHIFTQLCDRNQA